MALVLCRSPKPLVVWKLYFVVVLVLCLPQSPSKRTKQPFKNKISQYMMQFQKVQLVYHIHVLLWIALCTVRVGEPSKSPELPIKAMSVTTWAGYESHRHRWPRKPQFLRIKNWISWLVFCLLKIWKNLFVAGTKVLFVRMTFCPTRANYRKDIFMMKGSWTYSWSMKLGKNRHLLC